MKRNKRNEKGENFACSFLENVENYPQINMLEVDDFMKEVWNCEEVVKFRNNLINNIDKETDFRICPHYLI